MPLYEWECLACEITFEDLAPVSEGRLERACPSCGRMSPRVVSTFRDRVGRRAPQPAAGPPPRVRAPPSAPICLRYPHIPLLCHMDQPTAERAVAYAHGRGASTTIKKGSARGVTQKARACRRLHRPLLRRMPILTTRAAIRPPAPGSRARPRPVTTTQPRTRMSTITPPEAISIRRDQRPATSGAHRRTAIDSALRPLIFPRRLRLAIDPLVSRLLGSETGSESGAKVPYGRTPNKFQESAKVTRSCWAIPPS